MSKQVMYVGVDVGKDELWVATVGQKARKYGNSTVGVRALYRWAGKLANGRTIHICMEATGVYSRHAACKLCAYPDVAVSIVNPAQIVAYGRALLKRTKTDQSDAAVILAFAISQQPPRWVPESKTMRQLYLLASQADKIKADLRRWQNRTHAKQYESDCPKEVKQLYRQTIRFLQRQLLKIEAAIDRVCREDHTISQQIELLCSVPGIARLSAVRILAYGQNKLTERSRKELTAHAGLAPGHRQSGSSVHGRSRIAKQGDRRLRDALYMPALVGIVHNPLLKKTYQHLLDEGKPKMVALVACMRKLLLTVRALLINKTIFNKTINPLT